MLVTGLTGAVLGGLAWLEKRSGARALTGTAMVRLEGKRVTEPPHRARVTRLGLRDLQFEADPRLPDDALDVKLVIDLGDGRAGAGSYARIAGRGPVTMAGATLVNAVFTALDEADRERIALRIPA